MMSLTTIRSDLAIEGTVQGRLVVEGLDVGQASKMFMWWVRTYHPEIEEQFNAVEDITR